jgi:membrane-associated protease RseP (regulator of RpoE activity)
MVGMLRDQKLNVLGTDSAKEFRAFAQRWVEARGLVGAYTGDAYGPSDHTSFYAERIPVLFFFTGAHENYHRPSDDAETLNYPGLAEVGAVATDVVRALAATKDRPTYVESSAPPPSNDGRGYGPYFGSIPDFGASDVVGVKLTGVRKGSPAALAGVQKGDIIVRFNGVTVKNLVDYTEALRGTAPGDEVEIELLRDGKTVKTKAKLVKRGSD